MNKQFIFIIFLMFILSGCSVDRYIPLIDSNSLEVGSYDSYSKILFYKSLSEESLFLYENTLKNEFGTVPNKLLESIKSGKTGSWVENGYSFSIHKIGKIQVSKVGRVINKESFIKTIETSNDKKEKNNFLLILISSIVSSIIVSSFIIYFAIKMYKKRIELILKLYVKLNKEE